MGSVDRFTERPHQRCQPLERARVEIRRWRECESSLVLMREVHPLRQQAFAAPNYLIGPYYAETCRLLTHLYLILPKSGPMKIMNRTVAGGGQHSPDCRRCTSHKLTVRRVSLLLVLSLSAAPFLAVESHAIAYGCSRNGSWVCYPSPQRCYEDAGSAKRYSNYAACTNQAESAKPPRKTRAKKTQPGS
jgi:hypothetical protein